MLARSPFDSPFAALGVAQGKLSLRLKYGCARDDPGETVLLSESRLHQGIGAEAIDYVERLGACLREAGLAGRVFLA